MKKAIFAFVGCMVGMAIAAYLLPGITYDSLETALLAGALLGGIYLVLRPILRLITLPISCLSMGLIYVVLDAAMLWFAATYSEGISISSIGTAVGASIVVNAICTLFSALAGKG